MSIQDLMVALKLQGFYGHAGRPGKRGGSAPKGGSVSTNSFDKMASRSGSMFQEGDPEIIKAVRVGDLGDFGSYGKHYITGRHNQYLTVTRSKAKRFSEPNLSGTIHVSDLKSVIDPDRTWGVAK